MILQAELQSTLSTLVLELVVVQILEAQLQSTLSTHMLELVVAGARPTAAPASRAPLQ
eukprot:COSAG03_NODE_18101_length_362_cov_0.558935_1_plen_57_part_10